MKTVRSLPFRALSLLILAALLTASTVFAAPAEEPAPPTVTADAAVVMDYDTGEVLYAKDADEMRVPASMTKVMTAYLIFEELEAGNLTLDTMVPISAQNAHISRNAAYPMSVPLPSGGQVSAEDLLKLILVPSASASCIVMAEYIAGSEEAFVQRMNDTARRLGMTAEYENSHGAFPHYMTARSQAILVRECIQRFPEMLEYTSLTSVEFRGEVYENTNQLLPGCEYAYPGADGFKTGTISEAGYCLSATAVRDGQRIITVVMHSDDNETRHTDSTALLDYGFAVLEARAAFPDVAHHWSRDAVDALYELGVELHPDGESFLPDRDITRGEFTAMLCSALERTDAMPAAPEGSQPAQFQDTAGHWAEDYIARAAQAGLVGGVGTGLFSPDTTITRQEIMVILDQALDLPEENGLDFTDTEDIAVWALPAAARVTAAGLMTGSYGQLLPDAPCTRGEAAALVNALLTSDLL